MPIDPPITELLLRVAAGDRGALDEVFGAMYPQLRRIASARLYEAGRGDGLGTTSLVHESFLRLVSARQLAPTDRRHFFALASKCMRQTVIDELRRAHADRRGGGERAVTLADDDDLALAVEGPAQQVQALHDALRSLERLDPDVAEVADLRWFGGFDEAEIAGLQGVSERTVRRRWEKARAFLASELGVGTPPGEARAGGRPGGEPGGGRA